MTNSNVARNLLSATLALLALLLAINPYRIAETVTFQNFFSSQALQLVDTSLTDNLKMFATLSSIKGAMAMVEGSTIGASLGASIEVEVGDFIEPAYDYIDFVWNLFLYAILALTIYKLLLESGILVLGLPLAGVGILIWAVSYSYPINSRIKNLAGLCIRGGLIVSFGLTIALFISHLIGTHYFEPLKENARYKLAVAEEEFAKGKEKLFSIKSAWMAGTVKETVQEVASTMADAATGTFTTALYFVAVVLFELLLLPFITLVALSLVLGRGINGYATKRFRT